MSLSVANQAKTSRHEPLLASATDQHAQESIQNIWASAIRMQCWDIVTGTWVLKGAQWCHLRADSFQSCCCVAA